MRIGEIVKLSTRNGYFRIKDIIETIGTCYDNNSTVFVYNIEKVAEDDCTVLDEPIEETFDYCQDELIEITSFNTIIQTYISCVNEKFVRFFNTLFPYVDAPALTIQCTSFSYDNSIENVYDQESKENNEYRVLHNIRGLSVVFEDMVIFIGADGGTNTIHIWSTLEKFFQKRYEKDTGKRIANHTIRYLQENYPSEYTHFFHAGLFLLECNHQNSVFEQRLYYAKEFLEKLGYVVYFGTE